MKHIKIAKFSIEDARLIDDSMHSKGNFAKIETWYYDAILNNDFSVVCLINIIHLGFLSQVLTGVFIYKNNKLVKSTRQKIPYKNFTSSEKNLDICIFNKTAVKEYVKKNDEEWVTDIKMGDDSCGFNLKFMKKTKAFKGRTYLGNWFVIPHFYVEGKIFFDNRAIHVEGSGYHDHNMYPIYSPFTTIGYHFGKITLDSINLIWANVEKSKKKKQPIVIVNKADSNISIDPKYISFKIKNKEIDNKRIMPKKWNLYVDNEDFKMDVNISSIDYHYISVPTVNYWRYHVKNQGYVIYDSEKKNINSIDISEYLKFL